MRTGPARAASPPLPPRPYNASRLATVVAAVITSNTALATMPGNVFLPSVVTGLKRDSVVNVTAIVTMNKEA